MIKWLNSKLTIKKCCIALGVILVASVVPLFLMGRYAFPAADDFFYGYSTHEAWVQTRSLVEVVKAGVQHAAENYQNWQGTFFACFLMTLQPGIFGVAYYQIVPVFLITSLVVANILFFYVMVRRVLGGNLYCALSLAFLCLIYSIQLVPHPGESFYWYNGAVYYTFSHSVALVLFSFLLLCYTTKRLRSKIVYATVATLLAVCVGGSNYTTALLSCVLMGLLLLFAATNKLEKWWFGCFPAIACVICLLISVLAPGNNVRRNNYEDTSLLKALYISFLQASQLTIEWIALPLLIMLIMSLPFIISLVKETKFRYRYPLLFVLGSFCCFAACFYPTAYTAQGELPGRNVDILFYLFALFCLACEYYIVGWLMDRNDAVEKLLALAKENTVWVVALVVISTILCVWPGVGQQNTTGISSAYSLAGGEAKAFGEMMDRRFALLYNDELKEVYLPAKYERPWVLPQEDLMHDPDHWSNAGLAQYFNKDLIYICYE